MLMVAVLNPDADGLNATVNVVDPAGATVAAGAVVTL